MTGITLILKVTRLFHSNSSNPTSLLVQYSKGILLFENPLLPQTVSIYMEKQANNDQALVNVKPT